MPWRPLKVEKFKNQTAKPTGSPFHSAIAQNSLGSLPNKAFAMSASVASTSCESFSYSASSRTKSRTSPASPGRTRRMLIVTDELEILVTEGEDILHVRIDPHHRQRTRRARELKPRLLQMVGIEMGVAERMHEVAGLETRDLRHHHG